MSIRIIQEVLRYAPVDLGPAARLVLVCLAEDARDDRIARYSSRDRLMAQTGLSRAQITRIIADLETRCIIRKQMGKAHKGQIQQYRIAQLHAHHQAATVHYLDQYKGAHPRASSESPPDDPKGAHPRAP